MKYINQKLNLLSTKCVREELRKIYVTSSYQQKIKRYGHIVGTLKTQQEIEINY